MTQRLVTLGVTSILLMVGIVAAPRAALGTDPGAFSLGGPMSPPSDTLPPFPEGWESEVDAEHPLAGILWAVEEGRKAQPDELVERAREARFVLLGETHDNPDHHRFQAWMVQSLAARDARPAVVLEMIRMDRAEALYSYLRDRPGDAEGLGPAVGWEEEGWPDWSIYRPIAEAALAAGLPLHPGDVARSEQAAVSQGGLGALDPARRRALALDEPLPEGKRSDLGAQLMSAHCDHLPEEVIPTMIQVQRLRDAAMADYTLAGAEASDTDQAILIAGRGHVRADRGVPWYFRARGVEGGVLTVGLVQVDEERMEVEDYLPGPGEPSVAGWPAPYDFIWLTPRPHDRDPCEAFREGEGGR